MLLRAALLLFGACATASATSASTTYAAAYAGKSEDMLAGKYSLYVKPQVDRPTEFRS